MIARLLSALRRTAQIAFERPRTAAWTIAAAAAALFAVAVAWLAADNVDRWTDAHRGGAASMVVYLGETVDDAQTKKLVAELTALPGVERAELVSPAESARRLRQALPPGEASLVDGVDAAALPPSIEIALAPGVRDVVAMSPTLRALRGAPGVVDVEVADVGEDRVARTLGTVRTIAWSAAGIVGVLALVVVIAALRVRLERNRRELAVAHLLGAGPGFFAVPTALAGALVAIVATFLAAAALYWFVHAVGPSVEHALAGVLGPVEVVLPTAVELLGFTAAAAALGLVGGGLAGAGRAR